MAIGGQKCEAFRTYGEQPYRAIVLHGGPGAPGCAAGLCRELAQKTGVVEHLQRGQSIDELIEEIRAAMEACSLERSILIGHSFGAWLALLFAERYPERVSKTIIIGCGPLEEKYLSKLVAARTERISRGRMDTDNFCALPNLSGDMLFFDREQHEALMREITVLRRNGELLARARRVKCPIVAFHGDFDPHPAEGIGEPMKGRENFRMVLFERCGHDPWKEKWARGSFFENLYGEIL